MNLLLDACTFLWVILDDPALSAEVRAAVRDPANAVALSAVSAWEIALKHRLGRLPLPEEPSRYVPRQRRLHRIDEAPFGEAAALLEARLPPLHRDPFDRALVAQAIEGGWVIATPDESIRRYPVRTLW